MKIYQQSNELALTIKSYDINNNFCFNFETEIAIQKNRIIKNKLFFIIKFLIYFTPSILNDTDSYGIT